MPSFPAGKVGACRGSSALRFGQGGDTVERRLFAFLKSRALGGTSLLIAFSGGSDSTALLRAAAVIAPDLKLRIIAAWVDHGIRPLREREIERDFVAALTASLGVPCDRTDPPEEPLTERALALGGSLEAEARTFRYEALQAAARRYKCSRILTAHTADDQAETLLMRFLSGSGAAGLRGIPEDRPPYLRPFLTLPKAELLRYLAALGQDWRDDSTNQEGDYLRNRLRRDIVPRLEEAVPGFRTALFALAEKSCMDEDLLSALTARDLPVSRTDLQSSCPAAAFWSAHPALRLRYLTAEAGRLRGDRIPFALVRAAALAEPSGETCPSPRRTRVLAEGAGLRFIEEKGSVCVVSMPQSVPRSVTFGDGYSFLFDAPGTVRIDAVGSCTVYWRSNARGPLEGTFDFPLMVRSRRPGDRLALPDGFKAIDELAADQAVEPGLRDLVPVLEDRRGIVGILASSLGGRDRYRHYPADLDTSRAALNVELTGFGPFL